MDKLRRCYGQYHDSNPIPVDLFGRDKSSNDGVSNVCKLCNAKYHKERRQNIEAKAKQQQNSKVYYQKNKEAYKERKRKLLSKEDGYRTKMVAQARCRARDKGLEFSITTDDVTIPSVCPVLGIEVRIGMDKKHKDHSPSIDRINTTEGYTKDNIVVVSWRANRLKNDSTISELKMLYEFYKGTLHE